MKFITKKLTVWLYIVITNIYQQGDPQFTDAITVASGCRSGAPAPANRSQRNTKNNFLLRRRYNFSAVSTRLFGHRAKVFRHVDGTLLPSAHMKLLFQFQLIGLHDWAYGASTISQFATSDIVRLKHVVVLFATTWGMSTWPGLPGDSPRFMESRCLGSCHHALSDQPQLLRSSFWQCVTVWPSKSQDFGNKIWFLKTCHSVWNVSAGCVQAKNLVRLNWLMLISIRLFQLPRRVRELSATGQLHSTMVSWSRLDGFSVTLGDHLGIVAEDLPSMKPKSLLSKLMSVTSSKFGFQQCWPLWWRQYRSAQTV